MLDRLMDLAGQHADILLALSLFSLISVGVTMTLGVRLIARLPADYFVNDIRREGSLTRYPLIVRIVIPVLKNLLGFVFILAGVLMLVLPGQGLLTLFAGLLLMNFPGKFACERWLVNRSQVRRPIQWLRQRSGQPPLILD